MAKRPVKRRTGKKRTTSRKRTSRRPTTGAKRKTRGKQTTRPRKRASRKRVVKRVTVRDLAPAEEFGGRHKARVERRPSMREWRQDWAKATRWQREDLRQIRMRRA